MTVATKVSPPPESETALMQFSTWDIVEAAENSLLYNEFTPANADDQALIDSIKKVGIREPLRLSRDKYLLSGHRRLAAAKHLSLEKVPVIFDPDIVFNRLVPDERVSVLRMANQQREKTFDERVKEVSVDIDPDKAYSELVSYRAKRGQVALASNIVMGALKERAKITTQAFLDAILRIIGGHKDVWPISVRFIHYALLNDPPLTHDSKPLSTYQNTTKPNFPQKLSDLITRARICGLIPMAAICDETRPVTTWPVFQRPDEFIQNEQQRFLKGYWRNLMQSQPHHVEIMVEKETQRRAVEQVAETYTIPVTTGKGICSLPPRFAMAERYRKSGKDELIILLLSDFDPDGVQLAISFARSMRDDFGIRKLRPIRVALTDDQVRLHDLPSSLEAKPSSTNYKKFVAQYGTRAVELDAMPRALLQSELRKSIEGVIDIDAFNYEIKQERKDWANIEALRRASLQAMKG